MKTKIYYLLLTVSLIACKAEKKDIKTIDLGPFKIKMPSDWEKVEFKGIDSYVGGLTNKKDTLYFDYGWYSGDFYGESEQKQFFSIDTINGKEVILTKPKTKGNGLIGVHFKKAYKKNKLTITGYNINAEDIILKAFLSIQFRDSDTSINSKEINLAENNNPYKGRDLFKQNCASCHDLNRNAFGPSIESMNLDKMSQWLIDTTVIIQEDTCCGFQYHKSYKFLTKQNIMDIKNLSK